MSNPVASINDHKEAAFRRLLQQYKDKPNLKAVIEIYADRMQELETVFISLYLARSVNDAVGVQLDQVGEIVGLARPGSLVGDDEAYRTLIFVKIGQNVSQGEAERIINVAKLLTGSEYIHLLDIINGNIELTITTDLGTQEDIDSTYRNLEIVLAGGVRVAAILCADETEAFAFEGTNLNAPALGFGNEPFENLLATEFNGVDQYAEITAPEANITSGITNKLSLFKLVKSPGAGVTTSFMSHWQGGEQKWYLGQVSGGNLEVILSDDGSSLTKRYIFSNADNAIIFSNDYVLVGFVYDGTQALPANQLQLFLNGVNVTAAATRGGEATDMPALYQPAIDSIRVFATNPLAYMPGKCDESIIFNEALTDLEVAELYNGGYVFDWALHSKSTNIVSGWRMGDGDTHPTIMDRFNNNNLTMINMSPANFVADAVASMTTPTTGGKFATHHEFKPPFAFAGVDQSAEGFGAGPDDPLCGGVFVE